MLCAKCNHPVPDGARFCGNCGEPVGANADATRPSRGPISGAGAPPSGGVPPGAPPPGAPPPGAPPPSGTYPGGIPSGGSAPAWAPEIGAAAPGLINRIKNIILTPKTEWPVIETEPTTIAQLYKGYVVPLAAFSALMSFVHISVIGIGFWRMPVLTGLAYALVSFILGLLGLYVVGWVIDMLAPTFSGQRDRRQALKTAAYASTPGAIGAIFVLLGGLGALLHLAAAIWGIYLLYLGLPVLMRSPREKAPGYTAAVIVCAILLFVVFAIIMSVVNPMRSYNPLGMNGTAMTREERQPHADSCSRRAGTLDDGSTRFSARDYGAIRLADAVPVSSMVFAPVRS
jgi:hypothetical protein